MKKMFLISLVSGLSISIPAFSQAFFGLQGGVNFSSLNSSDVSSLKTKAGYHAGIIFNTPPFATHFSIMPSVLYSTRGFKYTYNTTTTATLPDTSGGLVTSTVSETADVNATLGYIDIPVMLSFTFSAEGGLFIQAGPQVSYLINDKTTVNTSAEVSTNGSQPQPTEPTISHSVSFNKADFSLTGGIGYRFSKLLLIYVRASSGFLNVQKDGFITDSNAGHNLTWQAGLALILF